MSKTPQYEIYVRTHFAAAHHLRGYDGVCARPHGHNWTVDVHLRCSALNELGIGIDFRDVKAAVKDILQELDHNDLNALPDFAQENPSSENIAALLYRRLSPKFHAGGVTLTKVSVSEGSDCGVVYWEE